MIRGAATAHVGWANNWRALARPGTRAVSVPAGRGERRLEAARLRDLPSGTPVALSCSGAGSRWRSRHFAVAARVLIEREYIAFPSAEHPAFLLEATDATIGHFFTHLAFVPPGVSTLAAPAGAALAAIRRSRRWTAVGSLMPSRIVLGVRA